MGAPSCMDQRVRQITIEFSDAHASWRSYLWYHARNNALLGTFGLTLSEDRVPWNLIVKDGWTSQFHLSLEVLNNGGDTWGIAYFQTHPNDPTDESDPGQGHPVPLHDVCFVFMSTAWHLEVSWNGATLILFPFTYGMFPSPAICWATPMAMKLSWATEPSASASSMSSKS